jgi:hypothetical protein
MATVFRQTLTHGFPGGSFDNLKEKLREAAGHNAPIDLRSDEIFGLFMGSSIEGFPLEFHKMLNEKLMEVANRATTFDLSDNGILIHGRVGNEVWASLRRDGTVELGDPF